MAKTDAHPWEFKARFRRNAFGWRSQPAVTRIRQAVAEIKKVARKSPLVGGEGAVTFLERLAPAIEHVDSSSGSVGTAVGRAIDDLAPLIAGAPADPATRSAWLDRLWAAVEADQMPYLEGLGDHWGALCASREVASAWADRLIDGTRHALDPAASPLSHFHGSSLCFSALFHAGRHQELIALLNVKTIWQYKRWAVLALAARGDLDEALRCAEASRDPWTTGEDADSVCEALLLDAGRVDEAYARYGRRATQSGTFLASFRMVIKKYPHKGPAEVLADLVRATPGDEGKWFAAAKEAGLCAEALALAGRAPCDPKTLTRAARDHLDTQPAFALGAGILALHWLVQGVGYDITSADVWAAYRATIAVAERHGNVAGVRERVRALVASVGAGGPFVRQVLGRELGL
ncbi:MAG: hypothetical protein HY909_31330 [Deltaproteobacteria bacterium]|nr:hypothetical protein [Deltaproteobacteria bacterium]